MAEVIRVEAAALEALVKAIFADAGVPQDDAGVWARSLVWANLRGMDSHGVLRVPFYLEWLAEGRVNANPDVRVLMADGAMAAIDADRAPGPVGMIRAMDLAIERAGEAHLGWCAARNITHAGAVGQYARRAAEQGLIGIVMTASAPLMAYHGSCDAVVSTNPIAIAIPAGRREPLVLDIATSAGSFGKILSARAAGALIPEGWGIDAAGRPTTDPNAVKTLLPVAGNKGAGLSLMIECLASLLAANPVLTPVLAGTGQPAMNGTAIAVDVSAFCPLGTFRADVDALAKTILAQPKADGVDRLLMPGDRGDEEAARRLRDGIPLPQGVWETLVLAAAKAAAPLPPVTDEREQKKNGAAGED